MRHAAGVAARCAAVLCFLPALAQAATPIPATSPTSPAAVSPVWTVAFGDRIEWAALGGPPERPRVLTATSAGRVHVLDAASGTVLEEPLRAAAGVRLAGFHEAAAVCFDRNAIYCLRFKHAAPEAQASDEAADAAQAWRFGEAEHAARDYPGDPEWLSQWLAVGYAGDYVVGVHSTGRVVQLDVRNGSVRSEGTIPRPGAVRLHVSPQTAAVIWKSGADVQAASLNVAPPLPGAVASQQPRSAPAALQAFALRGWPSHSALGRNELVMIRGTNVEVWDRDGRCTEFALHAPPLATNTALFSLRAGDPNDATVDPNAESTASQPAVRLDCAAAPEFRSVLVSAGPECIEASDARSGERLWRQMLRGVQRIQDVRETHLLVTHAAGVAVIDMACGAVVCECPTPEEGARVVSASYTGGELLVLTRAENEEGRDLFVTEVSCEPATSKPVQRRVRLELPTDFEIRDVLWRGGGVVLVGVREVRAYGVAAPTRPDSSLRGLRSE